MISKLKSKKGFLIDFIVNAIALTVYIVSQQLILMPIMSKMLNESSFALFVMYISIFAIISNTLGSELGIVRQIFDHKEQQEEYNLILKKLLIIVFFISFVCTLLLGYNYLETIMLSVIIVLANIRLYVSAYFRMFRNFKFVLIQNVLYLVGVFVGVLFYQKAHIIWIPCLIAEIFAIIFSFSFSDIKYIFKANITKKIDKKILISFKDYSLVEFLINMMTYFDKILIYPILGVNSVNVYYATTTMSKVVSLITNPMHGVLLTWLKNDDKQRRNNIISLCLKYSLPVVFFISIISIPLTYLAVKIFYNQYLEQTLIIIIPIGIGVGFSFASSIIKAFLLKFVESKALLKTYIYYLISFVLLSLAFSSLFNLWGFAIANMLSRIILIVLFFDQLIKIKKKETD